MAAGQIQITVRDAYGNTANTFTTPQVGPQLSANSLPVVVANDQILTIVSTYSVAQSWNASVKDMREYDSVIIHCTSTPNTAYTIQGSPDGNSSTFYTQSAVLNNSLGYNVVSTISAIGKYSLDGRQYVQLANGSGGSFFISGS